MVGRHAFSATQERIRVKTSTGPGPGETQVATILPRAVNNKGRQITNTDNLRQRFFGYFICSLIVSSFFVAHLCDFVNTLFVIEYKTIKTLPISFLTIVGSVSVVFLLVNNSVRKSKSDTLEAVYKEQTFQQFQEIYVSIHFLYKADAD